jgi:hypothetical protein
MRIRSALRVAFALLCATTLAAGGAAAEAPRTWSLAFEVLSSLHGEPQEGRKPSYAQKDRLARATLTDLVPQVWATFGARPESGIGTGGYQDEINPAINSHLVTTEAEARRLGAALGYVFRQYAVLVYTLDAESGNLRYVSVRFARGTVTPILAERYFAAARSQLKSDKLGFTTLVSRLIFINLNTGIADDVLVAGLARAAASLANAKLTVDPPRPARAYLVENNWEKAKEGEEYVRVFGPNERVTVVLAALRQRHDRRVRRWMALLPPERPQPPVRPPMGRSPTEPLRPPP